MLLDLNIDKCNQKFKCMISNDTILLLILSMIVLFE